MAEDSLFYFYESSPLLMGAVELTDDADLLHLYGNPASSRFFGVGRAEAAGRKARELGAPESSVRLWRDACERAGLSGQPVRFDYTYRQDGVGERVLAVRVSPTPSADAAAGPRYCFVAEDVTEQRRAEAALAASEARLRATFEQAAVGVAHVGLDGRWLRMNARLCAMLGFAPEELAALTFQQLTHPDDLQEDLENLRRLLAGDVESYRLEKRYIRADGSLLWAQLTVSMLRDAAGRAEHFIAVIEDISARKTAEERLRESEQRYREKLAKEVAERTAERDRIWNAARDLMCVARPDGVFLSANPAWETVLGWRADEVVGRRAADFQPDEDVALLAARLTDLKHGVPGQPSECRYRRKDGSWRWISWVAQLHDGLIYSIGRDVTDEKEAREALEAAESALRQAAKMEAVGRLTGGIAHDFNNLLASVVGALELIHKRAEATDQVRRYAQLGLEAADRGAKLTAQLLTFSRAQALQMEPVVVGDLVERMAELLQRALGPSIRLGISSRAAQAAAVCDATQLEMAVLNLAINARDAMPEGGELRIATELVRLTAEPDVPAGDYVQITVADQGVGMSEAVIARAFDPFFTTKGAGQGTGLGLSQVYGVVRQAGGAARIESRPGEGSTVILLLPLADRGATGVENTDVRLRPGPIRATVLVVDDDPDVRCVTAAALETLGCRALEAADGATALALLERDAPDVLLADYAMPGMNGAELARAARARRPELPIVFASGYADTAAIRSAVGADAPMLRKPFRMDQLQAMLLDVLGAERAVSEA